MSGQGEDELDPEFKNTPTHVTVKEGALAILPCWVRFLGKREVHAVDDTAVVIDSHHHPSSNPKSPLNPLILKILTRTHYRE
ncbi:hypothetical protein ACOMHN_065717 [Nucella lapillus]